MRNRLFPLLLAALPTVIACSAAVEEDDSSAGAVSADVMKEIGSELGNATSSAVLTKNEDAFAAKLAVIESANRGDTLDISYYILSDDESGALYATRLVEAAKRGVKVRVMLDYLTNFVRYHYFKAMQDAAGGNLEFRFYNKPNANIVEGVKFLVTPCPDSAKPISACTEERTAGAKSAESKTKAELFLAGLYSKNAGALQASFGPTLAQFEAEAKSAPPDAQAKANAIAGMKLLFDAKVKGDLGAMLMVFLAGDKLAPLNTMWSAIVPKAANEHANDWEHLTDFSHQKLTLRTSGSGAGEVVVGGRNIENSYNLSELPPENGAAWKKKYVFMDVDLKASFASTAKIKARFEKIWGFSDMVATMGKDLEALTPVNLKIPGTDTDVLESYTYDRIVASAARMKSEYATYDNKGTLTVKSPGKAFKLASSGQFPTFDLSSDPGAMYHYVDNVPNVGGSRTFGSDTPFGKEKQGGKEIQELWARSIKDLCQNGDGNGGKVEIVFHNAYLSLPGRIQLDLFERAKLLGAGTRFECEKGVSKIRILTNSRESTDLSVVNVYNEAWMKPLLEIDNTGFIDYREFKTNQVNEKTNPVARSLHAKVMIFGNDVFIGSANADGRSQFMDSNNGIFIRNAPKLSAAYRAWLSKEIEPNLVSGHDARKIKTRAIKDIAADNASFVEGILKARGQSEFVTTMAKTRILTDSLKVYEDSSRCLTGFKKDCLSSIDKLLQPL